MTTIASDQLIAEPESVGRSDSPGRRSRILGARVTIVARANPAASHHGGSAEPGVFPGAAWRRNASGVAMRRRKDDADRAARKR